MQTTMLTCPDCGATLRPRKPVGAGKKVHCPGCNSIFTVPGGPAPPEPVDEASPPDYQPLAALAGAIERAAASEAIEEAEQVEPVPPEERRVWERKRRDPVDTEPKRKTAGSGRSPMLLVAAVICAVLGLIFLIVGIILLQGGD